MPHHVLVACMPKSASTFISNALANIAKLDRVELVPSYGRREQELCELCLGQNANIDYVAQQHVKHSSWTEKLCRDHDVSIIVLLRSLFDVIVSIRDHIQHESPISPVFFLDEQHINRDHADIEHMIAMLAIPWYVHFYMGWRNSKSAKMFLYEDFVADPSKTISDMLTFAGIPANNAQIAAGLEAAKSKGSRVNVGKSGRGRSLQPKTVSIVLDLLNAYPEIKNDRYIIMMREQAQRILAAHENGDVLAHEALAAAPAQKKAPAYNQFKQWFRRKSLLLGRKQSQIVGAFLLVFSSIYFMFFKDLIPNSLTWGRLDDFLVTGGCIFFASRLIARSKARTIRVTPRKI